MIVINDFELMIIAQVPLLYRGTFTHHRAKLTSRNWTSIDDVTMIILRS
jgi:hypothetical protein